MEEEERRVLELNVESFNIEEFMEANRGLMVAEVLSATEELIYKDLERVEVIRINVKMPRGKTVLKCSLDKEEGIDGLDRLLEWALEKEEYEMCHRIKLMKDYLELQKDDIRPKTKRRARKTK